MATFGERVTRLREERGWTQAELAAKVGIRTETINRIENGVHVAPRVHVLRALARTLGCSADYLIGTYDDSERVPDELVGV
jgi:transcriptional regulator with XRE-family HTH domain